MQRVDEQKQLEQRVQLFLAENPIATTEESKFAIELVKVTHEQEDAALTFIANRLIPTFTLQNKPKYIEILLQLCPNALLKGPCPYEEDVLLWLVVVLDRSPETFDIVQKHVQKTQASPADNKQSVEQSMQSSFKYVQRAVLLRNKNLVAHFVKQGHELRKVLSEAVESDASEVITHLIETFPAKVRENAEEALGQAICSKKHNMVKLFISHKVKVSDNGRNLFSQLIDATRTNNGSDRMLEIFHLLRRAYLLEQPDCGNDETPLVSAFRTHASPFLLQAFIGAGASCRPVAISSVSAAPNTAGMTNALEAKTGVRQLRAVQDVFGEINSTTISNISNGKIIHYVLNISSILLLAKRKLTKQFTERDAADFETCLNEILQRWCTQNFVTALRENGTYDVLEFLLPKVRNVSVEQGKVLEGALPRLLEDEKRFFQYTLTQLMSIPDAGELDGPSKKTSEKDRNDAILNLDLDSITRKKAFCQALCHVIQTHVQDDALYNLLLLLFIQPKEYVVLEEKMVEHMLKSAISLQSRNMLQLVCQNLDSSDKVDFYPIMRKVHLRFERDGKENPVVQRMGDLLQEKIKEREQALPLKDHIRPLHNELVDMGTKLDQNIRLKWELARHKLSLDAKESEGQPKNPLWELCKACNIMISPVPDSPQSVVVNRALLTLANICAAVSEEKPNAEDAIRHALVGCIDRITAPEEDLTFFGDMEKRQLSQLKTQSLNLFCELLGVEIWPNDLINNPETPLQDKVDELLIRFRLVQPKSLKMICDYAKSLPEPLLRFLGEIRELQVELKPKKKSGLAGVFRR